MARSRAVSATAPCFTNRSAVASASSCSRPWLASRRAASSTDAVAAPAERYTPSSRDNSRPANAPKLPSSARHLASASCCGFTRLTVLMDPSQSSGLVAPAPPCCSATSAAVNGAATAVSTKGTRVSPASKTLPFTRTMTTPYRSGEILVPIGKESAGFRRRPVCSACAPATRRSACRRRGRPYWDRVPGSRD